MLDSKNQKCSPPPPPFAAQAKIHTTFLLLILTEGMNVVLPNPIFLSGFGGGVNLHGRKGCTAQDSLELLHNLFQRSMRQEMLSRVTEK
jgi:hypothetical protein